MLCIDWTELSTEPTVGRIMKMAALPPPPQVAGNHYAIYEAYYSQVDPNGTGIIQALDAAKFLKKSRLSDVVLSKIWDLSDPTGKGYLDKPGLFVALKLVSLAQAGRDINMSNILLDLPPPKVGDVPKVSAVVTSAPVSSLPRTDWSIKPAEKDKYNNLFDSLQPVNGLLPGNKVKGVLMESRLPVDTLGKIWDLADQDKDGMLDRHEFTVAMHLVYKALERHAVPTVLPPELRRPPARPPSRPPSRPASRPASPCRPPPPRPAAPAPAQSNVNLLDGLLDFSPPSVQPTSVVPQIPPPSVPITSVPASTDWVVSAAERVRYDQLFDAADQDRDGLVSGLEIKDTFLKSGLKQTTLAHIWALCDRSGRGALSRLEFALAMWLVEGATRGRPPPAALAPNMLPPEQNGTQTTMPVAKPIEPPSLGPQPTPEMEAIAREVDALVKERMTLEAECAARERELQIKTGEANSLQGELDTLTATHKQLENQKGEAQKRLNDLAAQVEKLRAQVAAQEQATAESAAEIASRKRAVDDLKEREKALQEDLKKSEKEADKISSMLAKTVLAISRANIKISHLEEQEKLYNDALDGLTIAIEKGLPAAHNHISLTEGHSQRELDRIVRGATPNDELDENFDDSPESAVAFGGMNGAGTGFSSDPFKDKSAFGQDPFAPSSNDHRSSSGFDHDPFANSGNNFGSHNADPFGGDAFASQHNQQFDNKNNDDPFAILHAPTAASAATSPAPHLPPKKQPPPRPAPPRPAPPSDKRADSTLDFTEDPFKDYRYEDPFDIEDPFSDVSDKPSKPLKDLFDPFNNISNNNNSSIDNFGSFDNFSAPAMNGKSGGSFNDMSKEFGNISKVQDAFPTNGNTSSRNSSNNDWFSEGRSSSAAAAFDPFSPPSGRASAPVASNDNWAAFPDDKWGSNDNWAAADNWSKPKLDKNLNETWPTVPPPMKKEKSPKPVKYAKSLVHTLGGIGRRHKEPKSNATAQLSQGLPSEEQQLAWAASESKRLEREALERQRLEQAELELALALSRSEK